VLMFDGDRAGLAAAERAHRELLNSRLEVRVALVGDAEAGVAKDPADVVVARAGEDPELVAERRLRFADVIDGAEDSTTVWFRLLRRRLDLSQAVHLETAARECASQLALVESPVRQQALLQEMARHLAVPAPTLERLLQKVRAGRPAAAAAQPAAVARPLTLAERTESDLLAAALARPLLLASYDAAAEAPLASDAVRELLAFALDGVAIGRTATADLLRYLFARAGERPELLSVLGVAADRAARLTEPEAVFSGLLTGRRRLHEEGRRRDLRGQLQQALGIGDRARADQLQQELLDLMRRDRPRPVRAASSGPAPSAPMARPEPDST
jgi:DNA primase